MRPEREELIGRDRFLRSLARGLVLGGEDPADAAQEAWLASLEHPPRPGPGLSGWFATVLRNSLRRSRRARLRAAAREAAVARKEAVPPAAEVRAREAVRRDVVEAVLSLSPEHRDVVLLRWFEELSTRETARRLGVPPGTVKSRLHRAHAELRRRLDDRHGDRRAWAATLLPLAARRSPAFALGAAAVVLAVAGGVAAVSLATAPPAPPPATGHAGSTGDSRASPGPPEERDAAVAGADAAPEIRTGRDVDLDGRWRITNGEDRGRVVVFDRSRSTCRVGGREVPYRRHANGAVEFLDYEGSSLVFSPSARGDLLVLELVSATGPAAAETPAPTAVTPEGEPVPSAPSDDAGAPGPPRRIELVRLPDFTGLAEEAAAFYAELRRNDFALPDGTRSAIPATAELGRRIRDLLPDAFDPPGRLAESHLAVLDRAEDFQERELARLALASDAEAVAIVLRERSWRDLSLVGRREVADVLASAPDDDAQKLLAVLDAPADPVVLMALFLLTGHSYGSPPRYLLEDDVRVPDEVAAHWRAWIRDEWPKRKALSPDAAVEAELAEIRPLLVSQDALDFEAARARTAALLATGFADYREALEAPRDRIERQLAAGAGLFARYRTRAWATEPPSPR